uniref:ABC transporter ATP-binding protein n=1 Tax=Thermorudis peleae TaxID=1382356 RepID=A0A831TDQ5_9BACT
MARLLADTVTLAYGRDRVVVDGLSLEIPDKAVTAIIGPNGCGKSTLLRALARLLAPQRGCVVLDGEAIHRLPTREVARRLSLLPQQASAPEAITVEDLVRRGRYPHQSFFQPPSRRDQVAVERALELAGMSELRDVPVDELSGGQRQRAWIAMTLAQETPLLLLDEPTTYLDIAHQQEVLALIRWLNREEGRTVVLVVHDVNHAAQVSECVVAMRGGQVVAQGPPDRVLSPELLERVFEVPCEVVVPPASGPPVCVPRGRALPPGNSAPAGRAALRAERLSSGYSRRPVLRDVTVSLPAGRVTAIVGPNACGKSTLLRTLARLLKPEAGIVFLDERPVWESSHREFARRLALLAQGATVPEGLLVEELVAIGRYPYQRWYRQWSERDQQAVERAMVATGVIDLRWRAVETLSGGQRQRAWLAMALAQETPVLLLDEPTTFLDIAHQVEVLDLVWELSRSEGRTVVVVLHDLNQACRYADELVVMKDGRVVGAGPPSEVVDQELVRDVFGVDSTVIPDPATGRPLVLPGRSLGFELASERLGEAEPRGRAWRGA